MMRITFPDGDRDWPGRRLRSGASAPVQVDGWKFAYDQGRWRAYATISGASA